jgi:hypothetical protein
MIRHHGTTGHQRGSCEIVTVPVQISASHALTGNEAISAPNGGYSCVRYFVGLLREMAY